MPHGLLGRQVEVYLGDAVVVRGKLLSFNEWGEVVLEDDMGGLSYSWPMLDVRLAHDPTEQGDWP